MYNKFALGPSW